MARLVQCSVVLDDVCKVRVKEISKHDGRRRK